MTTDTVGGVWTYALELARALTRAEPDARVALATMGLPLSPNQWAEVERLPNVEVFESGYKLEWMEEPWGDVREAGDWLLDIEARFRPDVVHLNGYAHGALPWRAPALVVGHSCVLSWWRACRGGALPEEWDTYRREVSRGLRAARLAVAPSTAMLRSLHDDYGPLAARQVVYNGRDRSRFAPGRKEPFVFTAGRVWDEAKNVGNVDCAARGLPWPVYLAGEQQSPVGGLRAVDTLQPLGKLSPGEMADWMGRASIYALPARYEPFGLSAVEAGLCGCALVLGDIPSLREIWGDAALFVPPDSIPALAAALKRLIGDPGLRRAYGARARMRALQFSPERMVAGYLRAYGALMSRPAARAG